MVTELVRFRLLETADDAQLMLKADNMMNAFMKKQDGYSGSELVKDVEGNGWCFIYHFENLEQVKAVGVNMRSNNEFNEFFSLTVPGSITVTLHNQFGKW